MVILKNIRHLPATSEWTRDGYMIVVIYASTEKMSKHETNVQQTTDWIMHRTNEDRPRP